MTKFEFLMMIAAVVVAVGLSEILAGWGRLIRSNDTTTKPDWLHIGFTLVIPFSFIDYWNGMWIYKDVQFVYFGQIAFLIIPSFFIVLTAYALSPNLDSDSFDSRRYYLSKLKPIWLSYAGFIVTALLADLVIGGTVNHPVHELWGFVLGLSLVLVLAFTPKVWLQTLVLALMVAIMADKFFEDITALDQGFNSTTETAP